MQTSAQPKQTILVVDDEESIRLVTSRILERQGYNVLVAGSGQDALQICRDYRPPIHLILADLIMPGMSGVEFVKQAITVRPRVRVAYISDSYMLKQAFAEQPGLLFIEKPFTAEELVKKVSAALRSP
jgi:two-component system cell cycle sensor histidine kinase/response regulator CckA